MMSKRFQLERLNTAPVALEVKFAVKQVARQSLASLHPHLPALRARTDPGSGGCMQSLRTWTPLQTPAASPQ